MDLFDEPLTAESVGAILDAAKKLGEAARLPRAVEAVPTSEEGAAQRRAKRHRSIRSDFSDEEDESDDGAAADGGAGPPKIAPGAEALVMRGFLL